MSLKQMITFAGLVQSHMTAWDQPCRCQFGKSVLAIGLVLYLLLPVGAIATPIKTMDAVELDQAGIMPLNALTTPFLFNLKSGVKLNDRVVLESSIDSFPVSSQKLVHTLLETDDEFARREAATTLQPYTDQLYDKVKHAQQYLILANVVMGEYDFDRHRFPLTVHMQLPVPAAEYPGGLYCSHGGYSRDAFRNLMQACLYADELQTNRNPFQWFEVPDIERAKEIRARFNAGKIQAILQIRLSGAYQALPDNKMLRGSGPSGGGMLIRSVVITHVAPVKIIALHLVDAANNAVVATLYPNASLPSVVFKTNLAQPVKDAAAKSAAISIKLD